MTPRLRAELAGGIGIFKGLFIKDLVDHNINYSTCHVHQTR